VGEDEVAEAVERHHQGELYSHSLELHDLDPQYIQVDLEVSSLFRDVIDRL
jgi:hypothetical protein